MNNSTFAVPFKCLNVKGVVERASDMLLAIKELELSNEEAKVLCRNMYDKWDQDGDVWEATAWYMAYCELFERQIRVEDPQCETPPAGFNGGFTA